MPDHWSDSESALRLLVGRWTLAVLGELAHGGRRYQDLHTALDRISRKVITDTLRRAEREAWSPATSTATGSRPPPSTN